MGFLNVSNGRSDWQCAELNYVLRLLRFFTAIIMIFRAGQFEFTFPRPTMIMGVVNVTPDSFSDGGRFLDPAAAVARGLEMIGQGAEIIDIGGGSKRARALPGGGAEEMSRVLTA